MLVKTEAETVQESWLGERLRDGGLWLKNLARYAPKRLGRVAGALSAAPISDNETVQRMWLIDLLFYLFDLTSMPEISQFVWRMLTTNRPLTGEEIAAAESVLGRGAIRFQDVRVAQGGVLDFIFQRNKNRAFVIWHTVNWPKAREGNLPLMVHELTHVYQYERTGSVYLGQAIWAQLTLGRAAYDYGGPTGLEAHWLEGKRLRHFNREQQGMIAQDYCALRQSKQDTSAYDPFIDELRAGMV
jgi:hypothetical protein